MAFSFAYLGPTPPGPVAAAASTKTTAFAYVNGADDNPVAGLVAYVRLVDANQTRDLWYRRNRRCVSDDSGLVSWELLRNADYEIKFGRGEWVAFTTGSGGMHEITPQVLGEYGS